MNRPMPPILCEDKTADGGWRSFNVCSQGVLDWAVPLVTYPDSHPDYLRGGRAEATLANPRVVPGSLSGAHQCLLGRRADNPAILRGDLGDPRKTSEYTGANELTVRLDTVIKPLLSHSPNHLGRIQFSPQIFAGGEKVLELRVVR
eukprot:1190874-Prorocentrum_minimum.AAC.1